MTPEEAPVLTATTVPVTSAMRSYPLATEAGIQALQHLINGDRIWSGCTKPQRRMLDTLCRPVIATLRGRGELKSGDLPELPESTTAQMYAALRRRGLQENRRLTSLAVYAWYWAVGFKESAPSTPGGGG